MTPLKKLTRVALRKVSLTYTSRLLVLLGTGTEINELGDYKEHSGEEYSVTGRAGEPCPI